MFNNILHLIIFFLSKIIIFENQKTNLGLEKAENIFLLTVKSKIKFK